MLLYYSSFCGQCDFRRFRYGIKGSRVYKNETTTGQYLILENLKPDTEYEFRVKLMLDSDKHYDFTAFDVFRTSPDG